MIILFIIAIIAPTTAPVTRKNPVGLLCFVIKSYALIAFFAACSAISDDVLHNFLNSNKSLGFLSLIVSIALRIFDFLRVHHLLTHQII